jgi:p-cymene methyl-monooxygenase electron transfer component
MLRKLFAKRVAPRVTLQPDGRSFEVGRNQTVLERALAEGIAFPHDCTVGTCGSCRSRLVSGKVDAITPFGYTLSKEELAAGYILACQAVPESDLTVEVDLEETPAQSCMARLVEARELTYDIRQVTWECDAPVAYKAGQYMAVSWPGGPGSRSYSFAAAPAEDGTTRLTTFIRKVPGGAFTERLFGEDLSALEFTIEAPHGSFWLREGSGPILLVGGGSGLAPLLSLLEDAANRGVQRDAILLFGGRGSRDLYCQDEIAAIAARWQGRFEYWPVLSEESAEGLRGGMVTAEIGAAIAALGGSEGLQAYLCGPPAMIDAGIAVLAERGVSFHDIHYDKFTDASTKPG